MDQTKRILDEFTRIANVAGTKFMEDDFLRLQSSEKDCVRTVSSLYGHPLDIVKKLKEWSQHKDKKFEKYPLIALFTDVPVYLNRYGDYDGTSLQIIIAMRTDPTWDAAKRNVTTFTNFLRPIARYFMQEIIRSPVFSTVSETDDIKATVYERYYWGRQGLYSNEGNVFSDCVDAIQIENLELKVNKSCNY